MTTYATIADMESFGLNARALVGIAPSAIQSCLDAASSIADSYLSSRYPSPPLTGWPIALRYHVVNVAQYMVVSGHIGFNPDGSHEEIRARYSDAIKFFEGISRGTVTLIAAETSPARGAAPSVLSDTADAGSAWSTCSGDDWP